MDIHKPKPWRGLREFLKEYAIIVIGVLTALGAEQAVDAMRWAHQVDAAEAALKPTFVREANNAAERVAVDLCVTQRLAFLSDVVRRSTKAAGCQRSALSSVRPPDPGRSAPGTLWWPARRSCTCRATR